MSAASRKKLPCTTRPRSRSVEVRRWGLLPHQGGTQREIRGHCPRGCPLGDSLAEAGLKWGRKPAPGLQSWRFRAVSDAATVPCGAVAGPALASQPPKLTPGLPTDPKAGWFGTRPRHPKVTCAHSVGGRGRLRGLSLRDPAGVGWRPEGYYPCVAHVPECACGVKPHYPLFGFHWSGSGSSVRNEIGRAHV